MASSSGQSPAAGGKRAAEEAPLTQTQPRRRRSGIDFDKPPPGRVKIEKCTDPDCLPASCGFNDFDIKIVFTKSPTGELTRNAAFLFNEAADEAPAAKAARKEHLESIMGGNTVSGCVPPCPAHSPPRLSSVFESRTGTCTG